MLCCGCIWVCVQRQNGKLNTSKNYAMYKIQLLKIQHEIFVKMICFKVMGIFIFYYLFDNFVSIQSSKSYYHVFICVCHEKLSTYEFLLV